MTARDARERTRFDAVEQVSGRRAGRDDDQPIARVERRALAGERDRRVAKRPKVSDPDQACYTGSGSVNQCPMLNAECSMPTRMPNAPVPDVGIEHCALSIVPCYCSRGGSRSERISAWARPSIISAPAAADEASHAAAALAFSMAS